MSFTDFLREAEENRWPVFGIEVYENGLLTHTWGDTAQRHPVYSATKSILSIAAGLLYDRGLLDPKRSFLSCLPAERTAGMTEQQRAAFEKLTLERLLTMSVAGFPFRPEGSSYLDFSLACPIRPEEPVFNYCNIDAYLTGVAMTHLLGRDLGSFLEEELLHPLGITDYAYGRCPEGYFYGASQMELSVHDLSKFGLLMSAGGVYEGRRLLSEEYARRAVSPLQPDGEGGYGYFFRHYRGGFLIRGKWGQQCTCLPDHGLVITWLSHMEQSPRALHTAMEQHLL